MNGISYLIRYMSLWHVWSFGAIVFFIYTRAVLFILCKFYAHEIVNDNTIEAHVIVAEILVECNIAFRIVT